MKEIPIGNSVVLIPVLTIAETLAYIIINTKHIIFTQ